MPIWARAPVSIWTEFTCLFNLLSSVKIDGHFFCLTTY